MFKLVLDGMMDEAKKGARKVAEKAEEFAGEAKEKANEFIEDAKKQQRKLQVMVKM